MVQKKVRKKLKFPLESFPSLCYVLLWHTKGALKMLTHRMDAIVQVEDEKEVSVSGNSTCTLSRGEDIEGLDENGEDNSSGKIVIAFANPSSQRKISLSVTRSELLTVLRMMEQK
jgi:hypothetical protein